MGKGLSILKGGKEWANSYLKNYERARFLATEVGMDDIGGLGPGNFILLGEATNHY